MFPSISEPGSLEGPSGDAAKRAASRRRRVSLWTATLALLAGAALTLCVLIVKTQALGDASVRTLGVALGLELSILYAGVAGMAMHMRRDQRALRDSAQGLETQTLVLEQQAARLEHRQRQIRALNEDLERRVAARTAELALANSRLEAANGAKSDFLANMSHEIRTPMTAVLGYADLLLDPNLDDAERLSSVQKIRVNGEHLLSIINDILDISKIEAGKMTVERIGCAPVELIGEVASLMRLRSLEKGLLFEIRYETPVPKAIESDPTRLRQILINLIGNAIKFTDSGFVRLLVRCTEAGGRVRLSLEVADTGIGLSQSEIERLFQPFSQADPSTTRRFGGTGLGLIICKRLAGLLGGHIDVTSAPGRGSSFTLTLDVSCPPGTAMIAGMREGGARAPDSGQTVEPRLADVSVLLAEDGPDNQALISTHLRRAGARVTLADNGRIAVEKTVAQVDSGAPFDVVLMDMQMPELDGYGATAALRSRGYEGAIIALTAHAMAGDRDKCLRAGCTDYLTKPIQRGSLLRMVHRYVPRGGP